MTLDTIPITSNTSISIPSSFWSFDNNTLDSSSILNGVGVNSPTFIIPGINGYGSALLVNGNDSQYVNVSTYRNLSYTSFTIEMWFYCTVLSSGFSYGLFGQHHAQFLDQSLHILIRNSALYLGFWGDDLNSSSYLQTNTRYHGAFVYDYSSSTQKIYLNGQIDGDRSSSPYQGTSGSILIRTTEENPTSPNYFSGYIDEVSLVMRAKTSSEILDDATLVTWQSFDNESYYDAGPLHLIVTAVNVTLVNGRVNQAINFASNSSSYQICGFVLFGISNCPYSIALWIRPSIINGSTLVHLSTATNGQGWCLDAMGFSSIGQIVITSWNTSLQEVIGPILPVNVWTHVVNTYSTTNGLQLYVNETFIGTTGSITNLASGQVNIITLGNSLQDNSVLFCSRRSIISNVYYGSMDEFRVYSRELNATDIYTLANP